MATAQFDEPGSLQWIDPTARPVMVEISGWGPGGGGGTGGPPLRLPLDQIVGRPFVVGEPEADAPHVVEAR